jgi:hypothetical protein
MPRTVARTLINWKGGVYSYIRVLPDGFLEINSKQLISKEVRQAEHEYMNIHPQLTL